MKRSYLTAKEAEQVMQETRNQDGFTGKNEKILVNTMVKNAKANNRIGDKLLMVIDPKYIHIPEWQRNIRLEKAYAIGNNYDKYKWDVFLPSMDESETKILAVKENWLLETFANLAVYTSQTDKNKLMQCFNFNTDKGRVEALDGYRIGMRSLKNQTIFTKETVKINNMCLPVFKKIMSKKSEENVLITQDKKYIKLVGKDFTYVIRRVEGEYFNTDHILQMEENFSFTPDVKEFLEVVKCNYDLLKTSKKKSPMLIHTENGKLYSYVRTERYESLDEIESKHNLPDEFTIGFNPLFLMEAFNIIDADKPECIMQSPTAPMVIKGNEYKFLVLPVNITGIDTINVSKKINEVA